MKTTLAFVFALALAAPAAAQTPDVPPVSIRPFLLGTIESFSAMQSFDAVFGRTYQPFFGGGVQVVVDGKYFIELSASRFKETGQRAFISNGKTFQLGIPLEAQLTPFEITGGYRYTLSPRIKPYGAAGVGIYLYKESSDFSDAGASPPANAVDVDTRHAGFVLNGGAEFRLHRWIGIDADVQYTHVPGILGTAGVSQQAGEDNLGGFAGRLKLVVGR